MVSGVNPKRRWLLAFVALAAVAAVVGFSVSREDPKTDPPRLVFLRQVEKDGQRVAVFRFDAPKRKGAAVAMVRTQNLATGVDSNPVRFFDVSLLDLNLRGFSWRYGFSPWLEAKAGQSKEFGVAAAPDQAWRLRCDVLVRATRIQELRLLLRECWDTKSLRPLRRVGKTYGWGTLESEPITNAVARTVDASDE